MDPTNIQAIVLDVDGVLTDGRVTPGTQGDIGKKFHVRDGLAIKLWLAAGKRAAILSGRHSEEVSRRAAELRIETVRQGVADKRSGLMAVLSALDVAAEQVAYVGDDLPDATAMSMCGLRVAVGDAVPTIKRLSHFVTARRGGNGAVAEFVEWLMRKQRRWEQAS